MKTKLVLVQILRGAAAFLLLLFHSSLNHLVYFNQKPLFNSIYSYGWLGSEFFFGLSGFILTYIHLDDIKERKNATVFLKKRFIRIYPIFWVVASFMLLYYLFVKTSTTGPTVSIRSIDDVWYIIKCYLLVPLYHPKKNFIESAWPLSFEIFFYLVFTVCITLGLQKSKTVFWAWLILILLSPWIVPYISQARFFLRPIILNFLSGCAFAYIFKQNIIRLTVTKFILWSSALIAAFVIYKYFSGAKLMEERSDLMYSIIIMFAVGLVLWGSAALDRSGKYPFSDFKRLLFLGNASYSFYLTHIPALMVFYRIAAKLVDITGIKINLITGNIIFLAVVMATILVGVLFNIYVEQPLLAYLNGKFVAKKTAPIIGA